MAYRAEVSCQGLSTRRGGAGAAIKQTPVQEVNNMMRMLSNFLRDESGVTAIEYGLIAGLVGVVIIGAVTAAGGNLNAVFSMVCNKLNGAVAAGGAAAVACPA